MNSSSIFSSRVSRSSSRNRARSLTVSGGSSPACSRRYMPTQFPRVPSLIPSSFATLAIGRDVSITIFTASSLNSGEKLFFGRGKTFTFPDVHPIGWTVRKARGTSWDLREWLAVWQVVAEAGPAAACPAGSVPGCAFGGQCSPGADFADVGGHEQQRGEDRAGGDAADAAAAGGGEGL